MKLALALIAGAMLGALITWKLRPEPEPAILTEEEEVSVVDSLLTAQQEIEQIPFRELIPQVTNDCRVLPLDQSSAHLIECIKAAAEATRVYLNDPNGPAPKQRRPNEISRFAEDHLREALNAMPRIKCEVPLRASGKRGRSGYPDLMVLDTQTDRIAYLDPKLYEQGSETSSFRTFYFQPNRTTTKILHDAHHFIVSFRHDGNTGAWHFDQWQLVDLYDFEIGLKVEFNSSNRDLYREDLIID